MRGWTMAAAAALLAGCAGADTLPTDEGPQPSALQYSAETSIAESFPVQLLTTVRVHNPTGDSIRVTSPDGCEVILKVYASADRTGTPAWVQNPVCTEAIESYTIAPGQTLEVGTQASAGAILGSTLPDGRYYLVARVKFEGGRDLPAGEADLAN